MVPAVPGPVPSFGLTVATTLIETILTKLPLRDAVRTSILSTEWRYKWATLTQLEFNDECVLWPQEGLLTNSMNRFLLRHEGPINKFALSTSYAQSSCDVDQWLLFLSRKDVKELVLELSGERFQAHSCLFSYQKLVRLELFSFELNPPLSFKGFPFLKLLKLRNIKIAPNILANLISSCPLLESLNLNCYGWLEVTIHALNLKYLILEGDIRDICLENAPKLVAITAGFSGLIRQSSSCNFDKFLGGVSSLQKLIGQGYFTKYMSVGIAFCKIEMKYQQPKVTELSYVNFGDVEEIKFIIRLIINAPNLQQLQIASYSYSSSEAPDLDFWEKECMFDCTFERLKIVKMRDMFGVPHEAKFIGYLLKNSPVLETITITPSSYVKDKLSFLMELTEFPRASTKATMKFHRY